MLTQRREVLSIYSELRALAWLGVMLIATGVGIVVKKHFDDIGPLAIAVVIGAAAAACYAYAFWRRQAALREYVVLLGALLISADVGFIENQWHLLGSEWQRHFLLLAVVHAIAAYYFDARGVMSLSVASLAAWLGIERRPTEQVDAAIRAFIGAAIVGGWRIANRREQFHSVFEHFAANFAFWGAIILAVNDDTRWLGASLAVALAVASIVYGFRSRRELFVIYGYVYGLIAVDAVVVRALREDVLIAMWMLFSTVAVIIAMIVTHLRFRHDPVA